MSVLHTIKAKLYPNRIKNKPDEYFAQVSYNKNLSVTDVCNLACNRGNSDLPATTIEHSVKIFHNELSRCLCDGFSVTTECYHAGIQINGVFETPYENFNPEKHTVNFSFKQTSALRKKLSSIAVEIIGLANTSATITKVTDIFTGSVNEIISPNRNVKISGTKIKVAGNYDNVGVYFANQHTGENIKVEAADIIVNNPSELIIYTPALQSGEYELQVVTQYAVGRLIKEPRYAIFYKTLTVE